jgi:hypothetical protein
MKNNQKGFLLPLIIILIAVAIGGGIYYSLKNNEAPVQNQNNVSIKNHATTTVSKATFPITVLSPNGGESYKSGDAINIVWVSTIKGPHKININLLGSDETRTILVAHNIDEIISPNNGESKYTWIVPSNLAGSFVVRVSTPDASGQDNIDNKIMDESNAPFTIGLSTVITNSKIYTNAKAGFSIQYPNTFSLKEDMTAPIVAQITFPDSFKAGTNLDKVFVTISVSSTCTSYPKSDLATYTTFTSNGNTFSRTSLADAAMGGQRGLYDTYTLQKNNTCYTIEKNVWYHDIQFMKDVGKQNLPNEYDKVAIDNAFLKILATFKVLK